MGACLKIMLCVCLCEKLYIIIVYVESVLSAIMREGASVI